MDQDVGRLQITVHGVSLVHVLEPSDDILEKAQGFILCEFLLPLQVGAQVSPFAELGDDVHVVAGLVDV